MICEVCLADLEPHGGVVPRHQTTNGDWCPMSGQPTFRWDEPATRDVVRNRSGGICEVCHAARATDMHHRVSRGVGGGWSPANILHLCRRCHARATDNPDWAYDRGISLRANQDPEAVPVIYAGELFLTNNVAPPRRRAPKKKGRR